MYLYIENEKELTDVTVSSWWPWSGNIWPYVLKYTLNLYT